MRGYVKVALHHLVKTMNYDNDAYINDKKEREVKEGNPQPTNELPSPFKESKHVQDMLIERKEMRDKMRDRGHAGSKHHPRG